MLFSTQETAPHPREARQRCVTRDAHRTLISDRGVKVWPDGLPETYLTGHWRCRFMAPRPGTTISHGQIIDLLQRVAAAGFDFIKTDNLYNFDGEAGYSLSQGE